MIKMLNKLGIDDYKTQVKVWNNTQINRKVSCVYLFEHLLSLKWQYSSKSLHIECKLYQNPSGYFAEMEKLIFKSTQDCQKKGIELEDSHFSKFQNLPHSCSNQNIRVDIERLVLNPYIYSQLILNRVSWPFNGERRVSLTNDAGTTDLHKRKIEVELCVTPYTKFNSKRMKDLKGV